MQIALDSRRFRQGLLFAWATTFAASFAQAAPPVISGTPPTTVQLNGNYSFTASARDPDGDAITFYINNRPWWAHFDAKTGRLWGSPLVTGTFSNIQIGAVAGGQAAKPLPPFSITVTRPPDAPTISGNPPTTAVIGAPYRFQPTVSDPNGNKLTFSIANKPAWATFNTSTGLLSGTPTAAGTFPSIHIRVTDGKWTVRTDSFAITVSPKSGGSTGGTTNAPPVISGTPPTTAAVGSTYTFRPTASDANKDPLSFAIANKPAWAVFSTTTGQLSGQPSLAHVGTYSNIRIQVSDGRATAALPAFAINVVQPSSGAATLTWTPPDRNTDGSALTNLAGYRVYYGTSSNALTNQVQIANPSISTYVVQNLSPGTYYFGVRAYNSQGRESALSNLASKTIQ